MQYHPEDWHPEHRKPPATREPSYDVASGAVWERHTGRAVAAAWALVVGLIFLTLLASLVAAPASGPSSARVAKTHNHVTSPGV